MIIIEKKTTQSTQLDAIKMASEQPSADWTVIWAHNQTAGIGRHNRKWLSLDGNVFWSMIIRPTDRWKRPHEIVFVNALIVRRSIIDVIGAAAIVEIKWPNDIILNGKKVAGSIINTGVSKSELHSSWLVIGTGVNVRNHPSDCSTLYPPSSLWAEGFTQSNRQQIIDQLNYNTQRYIEDWLTSGFESVRENYHKQAHRLHEIITIGFGSDKSTYQTGIYRGIDRSGQLVLETDCGTLNYFHSKDVVQSAQ